MITIKNLEVKEASRVYGDFVEKVAFSIDLNPVNIAASVAGGYAATRTYDKIEDQRKLEELSKKTIENDHYANIQNLLQNLKIVFTPINVIYSVNNQVFEIIKVDEMSHPMKQAFLKKDASFYRDLLLKKINIELQLAEQFFARNLLQNQMPEQFKTACHSRQWFDKVAFDSVLDTLDRLEKTASAVSYPLQISLDALRPFESFIEVNDIEKVANYFSHEIQETLSRKDVESAIKVGFFPDRVLFTLNGQLLEQLPILGMNDEGYAAFLKRDKDFFMRFFISELRSIEAAIIKDLANQTAGDWNKEASSDEIDTDVDNDTDIDNDDWVEEFALLLMNPDENLTEEEEEELREEIGDILEEKQAATLEEVQSSWDEQLSIERTDVDIWQDSDIHPLIYDWLLDNYYDVQWHETDLTALMQQIVQDFGIERINAIAYDKIAFLSGAQNESHSIYLTDFTFEKFIRTMNSLSTNMEEYQGGVEFEQLLFALDIITTLAENDDVFYEFGEDIPSYVAKLLKADNIRFVSDQVYDEQNKGELNFFEMVNSHLLRLWQEEDSLGLTGNAASKQREKTSGINLATQDILSGFAEKINPSQPYDSVSEIIDSESFFIRLLPEERNAVIDQVGRHVIATMYLKAKYQEFSKTIELLGEVVKFEE